MSTIELSNTTLVPVTLDLYRDIHKAVRTELFAVTTDAARLDPADIDGLGALAAHVADVAGLLDSHAAHEDAIIGPALARELPDLAERVESDHGVLDARVGALAALAAEVAASPAAAHGLHELHLGFASFTSAYLEHQDIEERVVMPALEAAIGVEAVVAMHQAIVGSIPPEEMMRSLALMLPAMNVDGRTELLGGMRAGAPAEVFAGVWKLTTSVLDPADLAAVARRLGIGGNGEAA
jgi:hypothetical protein